jgi:nucleoside phosphorylase
MSDCKEGAKIIVLSIIVAASYGIINDLVTANVCIEFFALFPIDVKSTNPVVIAIVFGVLSTWWVGLLLGTVAAILARMGSGPKLNAVDLLVPLLVLLTVVGVAAFLVGYAVYSLVGEEALMNPEIQEALSVIPPEKRRAGLAVNAAHTSAYIVGFVGAIIVWFGIILKRSRGKAERFSRNESVDVGILVALQEEFRELHEELPTSIPAKDEITGTSDYLFERPVKNSAPYRCAVTFVGVMGPTEAALATERFLSRRQPRTIVMLGIAAAMDEDVKLGDVVIASHVGRYLERAKIVSDSEKSFDIQPGGDSFPCSRDLVQASLHFEFAHRPLYESWKEQGKTELVNILSEELRSELVEKGWLNESPSFLDGPIASGPVVVASEEFIDWVKSINRSYVALEMEGGAMLATIYSRAEPSRSMILRGISDFGDQRKKTLDNIGKGELRRYATHNAVRLLWALLEAGVLPRAERV